MGLSVLLHLGLAALFVFGSSALHLLPVGGQHPGTAAGGAVQANLVSSVPGGAIPMPAPTEVETTNRLASDNPGAAVSRARTAAPVPKKSIALPAAPKMPDLAAQEAMRDLDQLARADVQKKDQRVPYGSNGPVSFNYSQAGQGSAGGGGVSFGDASFGTLYTAWVDHLRDRLQFYWSQQYRDPSVPVDRVVTVQFVINRAGQMSNIGFSQRTGIDVLDSMALHAVQQAAAESYPLPPDYARSTLLVRVSFELK